MLVSPSYPIRIQGVLCLQGDCTEASMEHLPKLWPSLTILKPGQCVVLGHEDIMSIWSPDIWVDNLYLRAHYKPEQTDLPREVTFLSLVGLPPVEGRRLGTTTRYFTNMTFQGDDIGPTPGVFANEPTYIEGVCLTLPTTCTRQGSDHFRWSLYCASVFCLSEQYTGPVGHVYCFHTLRSNRNSRHGQRLACEPQRM